MTEVPVTVRNDESVALAYRLLQEKGFRHLPVVDGNQVCVGMISDRDLRAIQVTAEALIEGYEDRLAKISVTDIMSEEVRNVSPDDTLQVAASYMVDHGFNSLPVVENNELVGIITSTDLLKSIVSES